MLYVHCALTSEVVLAAQSKSTRRMQLYSAKSRPKLLLPNTFVADLALKYTYLYKSY